MTYYRTHRPQRFADLLGQEAATATLQQALIKERVGHAYLLTGPRGTGKTSAARLFSRALCCLAPVRGTNSFEPCNTCEACLAILHDQAPDITEIDAASNRGIEDIRSLREQVNYPPLHLQRKVYIIDEVHMLTIEAFNALLKTLEEPPEYCLFILATTELQKVPSTIRSRCQLLRFHRGSLEDIAKKLDHIAQVEKLPIEKGVTLVLAKHAEGGYRDAETILESLSTQYSPLTLADTRTALGLLDSELSEKLLQALKKQDRTTTVDVLKSLGQINPEPLLQQLITSIRGEIYQNGPSLPFLTY